MPPPESLGESPPLPVLVSGAGLHSLVCGKSLQSLPLWSHLFLFVVKSPFVPLLEGYIGLYLGPMIIRDNSPS